MLKIYRKINLLSLDLAAGAIASAAFFFRVLHIDIDYWSLIGLGSSLWIIYTIDHLMDSFGKQTDLTIVRFLFQPHVQRLLYLLLVVFVLNVILSLHVEKRVLYGGLGISGVVLLYFVLKKRLYWIREMVVSFVFSISVFLPCLAKGIEAWKVPYAFLMAQFFLTVLMNVYLFSWYDRDEDKQSNVPSMAHVLGESSLTRLYYALYALVTLLGAINALHGYLVSGLLFWVMASVIMALFYNKNQAQARDYGKLIGDGVFLMPVIPLLFFRP